MHKPATVRCNDAPSPAAHFSGVFHSPVGARSRTPQIALLLLHDADAGHGPASHPR